MEILGGNIYFFKKISIFLYVFSFFPGWQAQDDYEAVQLPHRDLRGGGAGRNHGAGNAVVSTAFSHI